MLEAAAKCVSTPRWHFRMLTGGGRAGDGVSVRQLRLRRQRDFPRRNEAYGTNGIRQAKTPLSHSHFRPPLSAFLLVEPRFPLVLLLAKRGRSVARFIVQTPFFADRLLP